MTTDFSKHISTPVTLITGKDEKGNEYAYAKSAFVPDGWIDIHNECNTTKRYVANYIIPSVVKVRFGDIEMTRQEWEANGCPFELSREQMQAAEQHKAMQIVLDVSTSEPVTEQTYQEFQTLAAKYAPKPFVPALNCEHKSEYAVRGGMFCRACHRTRPAITDFEKRLVSKLTPRNSSYVNYGMR